jgi:DeoR/GlpR family transcriptional regulator of sugar metabolism
VQIANSPPLSFQRRQRIPQIVDERRSISVGEPAAMFPFSAITIRRGIGREAA